MGFIPVFSCFLFFFHLCFSKISKKISFVSFIIPDTLLKTCRNVLGGGIILDGDSGIKIEDMNTKGFKLDG